VILRDGVMTGELAGDNLTAEDLMQAANKRAGG
jgi:hypothetical protein